jgi:branched-chain amino acid transport system ATP-binding protein
VRLAMLRIENLTMKFGGVVACSRFNAEVKKGQIVGLIGPNGAGKTTVFNVVTGVYRPSDQIFLDQSLSAIYSISGGLPRVVNSLATNCLIYACQQGERYVDEECVYQAANELKL